MEDKTTNLKRFKDLRRRMDELKNGEKARSHREKITDGCGTVEVIEDLFLEMREARFGEARGILEDIGYHLHQLEESVCELERSQALPA